ncbi:MAG: ribonuclease III [Ruminococcaceae bacterium]|nr:ribonuclease III [Oscillospiraceae bacterium]
MEELERRIGYSFRDKELLRTAMTHSSYANETRRGECNERLEFLGDSVLSIVVSENIYNNFRNKKEGELTRLRASLVCETTLANFARKLGLGEFLLLGKGEQRSGGSDRPSILSDAFEALIAAIFLDGGMEEAKRFVLSYVLEEISRPTDRKPTDYKTILQEIVQQNEGERIEYVLVGESGPDHDKHFTFEVHLNSNVIGKGGGRTKKEAEQRAAQEALKLLGEL